MNCIIPTPATINRAIRIYELKNMPTFDLMQLEQRTDIDDSDRRDINIESMVRQIINTSITDGIATIKQLTGDAIIMHTIIREAHQREIDGKRRARLLSVIASEERKVLKQIQQAFANVVEAANA